MKNFTSIGGFSIITLLISVIALFAGIQFYPQYSGNTNPLVVVLLVSWFGLITLLNFYLLHRSVSRNPKSFVRTYYISVMIRMLLSVFILAIFILKNKAEARPFVVLFASLYFIYFVVELLALFQLLKKK